MGNVFIAIFVAAAPLAAPAQAQAVPAPLDLRCFQLMAQLSEDEDPRMRSVGRVAAQYFLGRIDAAAPGFDPEQAQETVGEDRDRLLTQCSDVMRAGGRDFRSIGEALRPRSSPAV